MPTGLSTVETTAFSASLHVAAQQLLPRLRPAVMVQTFPEGAVEWAYDGVGSVEAMEVFGHRISSDSTTVDTPYNRRKIAKRKFALTVILADSEVRNVVADPAGVSARLLMAAMARKMDAVINDAFFATVYTGNAFATSVAYDSDGVETVDMTAGASYEGLLEIMQNFIDNEVGLDMPEDTFRLTITGKEHTELLQEQQLTSGDFSRAYVAEKGRILEAAGFSLITFGANTANPILDVTSAGIRRAAAFAPRSICLGMVQEPKVTFKDRPDLINATQIQITGEFGATRTEGKLIQEVTFTAVAA